MSRSLDRGLNRRTGSHDRRLRGDGLPLRAASDVRCAHERHDGSVGAAWYRTYTEASHGYGFVAEDVPELSIAVIASRRHEGIGRRLLVDLVDASLAQGSAAISLSVRADNPARRLYESAGFVLMEKHGTSWMMVRLAGHSD